ncbi:MULTISPECIES: toprim domain-containing protein [Paenibacillus]|uniref:Toprim sub domain-containing protein n=1 Tax=Paenibacillus TaxID=44249 RepID=UPI0022B8B02F|nr:Toprim sub domain-containing protein [Paenibacillus caseinilyticus]MCZ8519847.1 Toprim sub domain-containing protein [Paenibacillus caseinilyticus]
MDRVYQYIAEYILHSSEQLDAQNTQMTTPVVDVAIMKRTARTLRKAGMLTLSLDAPPPEEGPIPDMPLLKWTPGKRAVIEDEALAFEWLSRGWIMKEMRFKRDGRTIDRVHYRMGYRLFEYLQKQTDQERQERISRLERYRTDARTVLGSLAYLNAERAVLLSPLRSYVSASIHWTVEELAESALFPSNWNTERRIHCLDFVLAYLRISSRQEVFDWKEIGAQYYGGIGGSKAFDAGRDEFIGVLEAWSGQSAAVCGLISPGKITPLFFAGHLDGQWSGYRAGPVHALTDLSIAQDQYRTEAATLWLVENRGILTRLSAERDFLRDTGSLVVCVDGHLRSSHRRFIRQLIASSTIRQVMLWTDYDEDGRLIAGELAEAAAVDAAHPPKLKWIGHDHRVIGSETEYQQYMLALLQEGTRLEQEQAAGEAEDWRQWINH